MISIFKKRLLGFTIILSGRYVPRAQCFTGNVSDTLFSELAKPVDMGRKVTLILKRRFRTAERILLTEEEIAELLAYHQNDKLMAENFNVEFPEGVLSDQTIQTWLKDKGHIGKEDLVFNRDYSIMWCCNICLR